MLISRVQIGVCIVLLMLSVSVHGFAWSSKLDYPSPETEFGDDEDKEIETADRDLFPNPDKTESEENKTIDSASYKPMIFPNMQDRTMLDMYQIH
jgi:hypothetical protein